MLAPPPPPNVTGKLLGFVDRRGQTELRHGGIMAAGISPSGRYAGTGSADASLAVWDLRDGRMVRWIETPHTNIYGVAVTDDGKRVATTGWDGKTRVWNVATGAQLWESPLDAATLRFTVDGTRLVGQRAGSYRVWDASTGRAVMGDVTPNVRHTEWKLEYGEGVSEDARTAMLVTANGFHEVQHGCVSDNVPGGYSAITRNLDTGKPLHDFHAGDPTMTASALSPQADRVAVISNGHLDMFTSEGKPLAHVDTRSRYGVMPRHVALLLTDSPRYAVTWDHERVVGWDLLAKREAWHLAEGHPYRDPQLAGPDVVVMSRNGRCLAQRISDGAELWRREGCLHFAASTSSRVVVTVSHSVIDIVDVTTGKSVFPPSASAGPWGTISALAASPDGKGVAGFAEDHSLWFWQDQTARKLVGPPDPLWYAIIRFLANGQLAVVNEGVGGVFIHRYDVDRNAIAASRPVRLEHRLSSHGVFIGDKVIVAEVREHDYVHTAFDLGDHAAPRKLPMWKRPADKPHLELRNESLYSAVADATANRLYVTGENNHAHAWDLRTGRLVARGAESNGFVRDLVLTPDRKHLIVPRDKGPIVVLETAKLREVRRFDVPERYVAMVAVSPDSKHIVATTLDGLFAWRLADGQRVATVDFTPTHERPIAAAFSPDGKTLWVGTGIGNLLQFRVN